MNYRLHGPEPRCCHAASKEAMLTSITTVLEILKGEMRQAVIFQAICPVNATEIQNIVTSLLRES